MSFYPDRETFVTTAVPGARYPVCKELPLGSVTPASLYAAIRGNGSGFILESGKAHRHSYVASNPVFLWQCDKGISHSTGTDGESIHGDPFDALRTMLGTEQVISNPRLGKFTGGGVGYFSYDCARYIETLPSLATDDLHIPDCQFLFVEQFYEIDHEASALRLVYAPRITDHPITEQYSAIKQALLAMEAALAAPIAESSSPAIEHREIHPEPNMTPEEFAGIVRQCREYIFAGDIFQANLSLRFRQELHADPFRLYQILREINPSPYMSYFDLPGMAIASASPELLVRVRGKELETRPIAGTRPRGTNEEEDEANIRELIGNEKERAEHLMLVDLERNDIGRVARYGSVHVDEFMGVERYSHVIHIVSNVQGELAEGKDMFDAIRACFPGGTITGAPKVRSMEIIDELEPCRRGIYTGSIGWLGYDGNAELNIAIRTIVVKNGYAYAQAGAGIVADSIPEAEYKESVRKAEAALEAIRRANATAAPVSSVEGMTP